MKETLTSVLEKIKSFVGKLSKKTLALIGVALAAILVVAVVIVVTIKNQPYAPLFTNLTTSELTSILTYLDTAAVTDYRVEGDSILVPQAQEAGLKAQLIMQGYPKSGLAYGTYLGNVSALSTDADRRAALLFDLQDRLGAVIRCLDGVKDANVTIALGQDRSYVLDVTNMVSASASVVVTMQDGQLLSDSQAGAIRNLVSKSVSGLEIDNISLTDSMGNEYSGGDGAAAMNSYSTLKLSLEERENNKARTEIMKVLVPLYGEENIRVAVNCTVDVSERVGEYSKITSPEGAVPGTGVIGSEVYSNEIIRGGEAAVGGAVGTTTNSDLPGYVEAQLPLDGTESYAGNNGNKEYRFDENNEQIRYMAGTMTDMMVSVTINGTTAGNVDLQPLIAHIGTAARITAEQRDTKISVLVQPFYSPDQPVVPPDIAALPDWAIYAAIGGTALFLVLLILILILRSKSRKKKAARMRAATEAAALSFMPGVQSPEGADIMTVRTEKSMELRKEVRTFAENNPEIAAQLVRTWLRGGEDNYGE